MALAIECMVCMEDFDPTQIGTQIDKVVCGSIVDHMLCFGCEAKWRKETPVQYDEVLGPHRTMTCPTCRQHERQSERTNASIQRENADMYRTIDSLQREVRPTSLSTFAAQVAAEMVQAVQNVRDARRRELLRVQERAASAVARAGSPTPAARAPISTITSEEISAIDVRLMGSQTVERFFNISHSEDRGFELSNGPVVAPTPSREERRVRKLCASGRNCHSSSASGRSTTRLKCIHCNLVFCCRTCNECVGCRPIPSELDMLD